MLNTNFNLEEDVKVEPLVPQGNYNATVTSVSHDGEKNCIIWKLAIQDSDGVMSDGETPIDGANLFFRNWLPTEKDKNEMSSNGRTTKFQSKVNMLSKFQDKMKINMNTGQDIITNLEEGNWIGLDVIITVGISEYQGNVSNDVKFMIAA